MLRFIYRFQFKRETTEKQATKHATWFFRRGTVVELLPKTITANNDVFEIDALVLTPITEYDKENILCRK